MNNKIKEVAIIGAGPAGMAAAYDLVKKGVRVSVFELDRQAGGMAKTIELWNQNIDIGPHRFFSSDPRVNQMWLEVVDGQYDMVDRLTRIYYKKRFYYYPLKAFNALRNLGVLQATLCVLSYVKSRMFPEGDEGNFENWVTNRFGKRLYSIFFKTYSEKLWGIGCHELDADFAAQRIKKLSLWEAIKNAVWQGGKTKHKTLVDQFAYPYKGTGYVYEQMVNFVKKQGSHVYFETPVKRVLTENGKATSIELESGEIKHFDHIISSMPLTNLVARLPETPENVLQAAQKLCFRNTVIVYLKVESSSLFPDQWLYVHSPELRVGRITNFRNWLPSILNGQKETILALEYWCYSSDEFWKKSDSELIELGKNEARATGLLKDSTISDGYVYRIPKCYPVYYSGYRDDLLPVVNYLKTIDNLTPIGRYGSFKYNNQDHSILMGLLASEKIARGIDHDLWDINTDYEYQESSVITKTGLQRAEAH